MRRGSMTLEEALAKGRVKDSETGSVRHLHSTSLATGAGDHYLSTEIKRADGGWVHRNYLAR
jgi:hypothetical protein